MSVDLAAELRALASRVRRNLPDRHDPERFHEELSEIAHCLGALANGLRPIGPAPKGRPEVVTTVVNGRRIAVQRQRLPFAIFVGGK